MEDTAVVTEDTNEEIQKTEVTTSASDVDKDTNTHQDLEGKKTSEHELQSPPAGANISESVEINESVETGKVDEIVQVAIDTTESTRNQETSPNVEPDTEFTLGVIEPPKSLQDTPLIEINNRQDLEKLIEELKQEKELGIDLEWSEHGYKAVTCLFQISTKTKDVIIDAIDLKNDLSLLKDILMDPNILKIFHAAHNDLKWLQTDCDLFVVNMFDTMKAMQYLHYPQLGLDAALKNYGVVKDKSMQRADFRKRPLPPKYKDYARTDSHFLINIYQTLRNELIAKGSFKNFLAECEADCKVVYPKVDDPAYENVRDGLVKMHQRQLMALDKVNKWRHRVAQYVDVNTGHVLSKNNMKNLIMQMPVDPGTIVTICKSKYVKQHLQEIVAIMLEAQGGPPGPPNKRANFGGGRKHKLEHADFGQPSAKRNRNFDRLNNFDLRNTLQFGDTIQRKRNKQWTNKGGYRR